MSKRSHATKTPTVPLRRTLPDLIRNPLGAFENIGAAARGTVVRLNLGLIRPYLVTRPQDVQHVLRDHADIYQRDGMMWKSIRRLLGNGIITDGATWEPSRRIMQPLLSARHVASLIDTLARTISDQLDTLEPAARAGTPVDLGAVMTRLSDLAFSRTLFGGRMTPDQSRTFTHAVEQAFSAIGPRILLPFVPHRVPMPGDRAFRQAIREVDEVMLPLVRQARTDSGPTQDILSALLTATDQNGRMLSDRQVRDDAVSMFAAGFETVAVALTWLWVSLSAHPEVAQRLYAEVDEVVGAQAPGARHLPDLRYTRMVVQEVLRLYSPGWIIPRRATLDDTIAGTRVPAGATVLISPYLTHRLESVWDAPLRFDPERFTPDEEKRRHRLAYLPFGGGPHGCIGSHFFLVEAQLVVAAMVQRFRPALLATTTFEAQIGASLRPKGRVEAVLRPAAHPVAHD